MAENLPFAVVDVFSSEAFRGNQLGVVLLKGPASSHPSQARKQAIAREFNFSETVFIHDDADEKAGKGRIVDIFTPFDELPFAGHPTIGSLCFLGLEALRASSASNSAAPVNGEPYPIPISVKAGKIAGQFDPRSLRASAQIPHDVRIHANRASRAAVLDSQPGLADAVKQAGGDWLSGGDLPLVSPVNGLTFILTELPTVDKHLAAVKVTGQTPRGAKPAAGWEGVVLASMYYVRLGESRADSGVVTTELRTRMIEAEIGEDPATGSASCALASYLALQHGTPGGVFAFNMTQAVEMGRRSDIRVEVSLDESGKAVKDVKLEGTSVVTMRGSLELPKEN